MGRNAQDTSVRRLRIRQGARVAAYAVLKAML